LFLPDLRRRAAECLRVSSPLRYSYMARWAGRVVASEAEPLLYAVSSRRVAQVRAHWLSPVMSKS